MSVRMMAAVFDLELPPNLKIVALAVADNAGDNGVAWPGVEEIARKSGYKRRQTITLLAGLVDRGVLEPLSIDEMPEPVRSRLAGVPVNRRPVVYLLRVADVQSLHPAKPKAVPAPVPVDVQPAAPQEEGSGVQVEPSRGALQRHSGVQLIAHKTSSEPSENQKTESSLRSDSAPQTPQPNYGFVDESDARAELVRVGFRESPSSPWLFTRGTEKRDLLWDAVLLVAGIASRDIPRGSGMSKARDRMNAAVAEIRRAGGTPNEVVVRARRFVEGPGQHRGVSRRPTPHELASRWAELGAGAVDRFVTRPDPIAAAREQAARVMGGVG